MPANSPLLPAQRELFGIPTDVSWFNCAYMAPLARPVREAGARGIARKATPWRLTSDDFFSESEMLRSLFARLVGAGEDGVALIPAVSYGMALAAGCTPLAASQSVVVLEGEFPSAVYAWRDRATRAGATIRTVARPADHDWTAAILTAITDHTAVVVAPHCHWTDGTRVDLAAVGAASRRVGARLVVDATQSLGAMPFDVAEVKPDFVMAAAYKWLLGPYSMAFLWCAPQHRDGRPIEHTWLGRAGSEDFAGLVNYRDDYQPGARRYDVGERSNFALNPMAVAALELILGWSVERIAATLADRTARIAATAGALGYAVAPAAARSPHMLGLGLPPGADPAAVASTLKVRGVHVSVRGAALRISPHVWIEDADLERLADALGTAAG